MLICQNHLMNIEVNISFHPHMEYWLYEKKMQLDNEMRCQSQKDLYDILHKSILNRKYYYEKIMNFETNEHSELLDEMLTLFQVR